MVMAGLVPAIHVFLSIARAAKKTWMPASSAGMTIGTRMVARDRRADSIGVCNGAFGSDIRHRGAKFHRLSADAGHQGPGRVRSANGSARLRFALGVGSHPARGRAELSYHRVLDAAHGHCRAH